MNDRLFQLFYSLAHKNAFLDGLWVFSAQYLPIILTVFFVYLLATEKDPHRRLYFLVLSVLSVILSMGVLAQVIRYLVDSPRPFVGTDVIPLISPPSSPSMPSGHIMTFFPIALAGYYLSGKWRWYFIIGILWMGIARVVSGVHYPFDILAGIMLSAGCFFLTRYILARGGVAERQSK